jgi:hypothetical protein
MLMSVFLQKKLSALPVWVIAVYAAISSFSVYFCMYAFRKPFTAASFAGITFLHIDYKVWLVTAQVIGYMLSKFYGIKFISSMRGERRAATIVILIIISWAALLLFAIVPSPYNIIFLFINGFPLGMVWGLVFSFLEGRKFTEFMGSELSRAYTVGNGYIQATSMLNAPSVVNTANLGAIISSASNLGNTTIRRGHAVQTNVNGNGSSILRYYDIISSNNTNLNATFRFQYFNAELNGFNESGLTILNSTNNTTWVDMGFDASNTTINYYEKSGVNAFSRSTLSSPTDALPVTFLLFNASCTGDYVSLTWKTAREVNTKNFLVEVSQDGFVWRPITSVSAKGTSDNGHMYTFVNNSLASTNSFYRIVAYDINNRKTVSSVIKSGCGVIEDFKIWPNPVNSLANVSIRSIQFAQAKLTLYDSKGLLLQTQQSKILPGNNQLQINMSHLLQGTYLLYVTWGTTSKMIKLNKL